MTGTQWRFEDAAGGTPSPEFTQVRRGYDPIEVADYVRAASEEFARLRATIARLENRVSDAEAKAASKIDEATVAQFLGEQSSQLLFAARGTANELVARAEANAKDLRETAEEDVRLQRAECADEVAAERARSLAESRDLHDETMDHRRNILRDLTSRRNLALKQINDLLKGRDLLVQALNNVTGLSTGLVANLDEITTEPSSFVSLDPAVEGPGNVYDENAVLTVTRLSRSDSARRSTVPTSSDRLRIQDNDTMDPIDGTSVLSSTKSM